jgi:hypothetical protein
VELAPQLNDNSVTICPRDGDRHACPQISADELYTYCHYGIWVPRKGKSIRALEGQLAADRFNVEDMKWVGYRYFDKIGLPALSGRPEAVLQINRDNRTRARPLATQVAELMWYLFERYAKQVHALYASTSSRTPRKRRA